MKKHNLPLPSFTTLTCGLAILCLGLWSAPAAQADVKIATVDINRILNESKDAAARRKEFEQAAAESRKKIDAKKSSLEAMKKKLESSKPDENSKEVEQFKVEARNFERMVKDSDEELQKQFLKVNKSLTEKALAAVSAYAAKNKYDLVLDKSQKSRGVVVFGDSSADITDAIVKEMSR